MFSVPSNVLESGRHRHLRKAAAKFIALKQVQHRLNVWHTRVSCLSLELGKFGLKLATAHIMQRRNARFFRQWKDDCIVRPKKVAQTADLAKRELTKAKVRNGLAHWRIEARRIRLHRTACKVRVMAATAVAQQTLLTDDLRDRSKCHRNHQHLGTYRNGLNRSFAHTRAGQPR